MITDSALKNALIVDKYFWYVAHVHRGRYKHAKHTKLICDTLQKVETGELTRVMFFLPPRHSKSMSITETFPSYFIGKDPSRRVIEVSYSADFARKFGRANRTKISEFGEELFDLTISKENFSATNWGIEGHVGGMISAGVGGSITGEGADLLLIDDPIKNWEEAYSAAYREKLWNEWDATLTTRLHPGARVIIVLTRWHEEDLAGRLLKEQPGVWHVVSLPAEAEENDLLGREIGEPLWPERGFGAEWLIEQKNTRSSQVWASLYQQRPSPAEGDMIKRSWWQTYTHAPQYFDDIIQSWDCAFKDKADSSYVVGQVWGRVGARKYLLDQVRDRMDFPSTVKAIRALTGKWEQARAILIEDKANGPAVISTLKDEISGIIPVSPQGGKIARLHAVSHEIEAGNVYIPDSLTTPWVSDFIEEFAMFPNGANDDQVDAGSQALLRFQSRPTMSTEEAQAVASIRLYNR